MVPSYEAPSLASAANEIVGDNLVSGATIQFTIATRSMLPTIAPGDRVIARGVGAAEVRVGEIAMIRDGQVWLAHRLVEKRRVEGRWDFVTQGDNCLKADRVWSSEQICGKIVELRRADKSHSLESLRTRRAGAAIAFLLRHRPERQSFASSKINSGLVRIMSWVAVGSFQ
jgi:signal peptidase I